MIRVKSLDFLKKYPAIWNEDNWDELTDIEDGEFYFAIPFNLDPDDLDIDYYHDTWAQELKPFVDGSFFIKNINQFLQSFEVDFFTFYDKQQLYFYRWDENKLYKAVIDIYSRCEKLLSEHDPEYKDTDEFDIIENIINGIGEVVMNMKNSVSADYDYLPKNDDWKVIYKM